MNPVPPMSAMIATINPTMISVKINNPVIIIIKTPFKFICNKFLIIVHVFFAKRKRKEPKPFPSLNPLPLIL